MASPDTISIRLHLAGIKVIEVIEDAAECLVVAVTLTRSSVRCRACGFKTRKVHQAKRTEIRDLPVSGRPLTLVWYRRRFACRCGTTTTERCDLFDGKLTTRFASALFFEAVASTVNATRKRHCLSWHLVMATITSRVAHLARRRARRRVRVLCIDEKRLTKGHGRFSTIVSDAERGAVVAVIDGRSGASLEEWLSNQSRAWRYSVEVVITDMATCWRSAIAQKLPKAFHIVDRFHLVRAAMSALTEARRRAQATEAGRPHNPRIFHARWTIMRRADRLSPAQINELYQLFADHPHLAVAWELTQRFHRILEADGYDAALDAVGELADAMTRSSTGFAPGVRALLTWSGQWENYYLHCRWTNNCAEGLNTKIELLERKAYGFRNSEHHKIRILAECPGHARINSPPARLMQRSVRCPSHALSR